MIFWGGGFDYTYLHKKLIELKEKTSKPDIWDNPKAKSIFKEIKNIEKKIENFEKIEKSLKDLEEFYNVLSGENYNDGTHSIAFNLYTLSDGEELNSDGYNTIVEVTEPKLGWNKRLGYVHSIDFDWN